MTDTLPTWALTDGQPDADKIIKNLKRYGYLNGDHIEPKLNEDYPALFNLLANFMLSQMAEKYAGIIKQGKVQGFRDDDGNLQYRMDDDVT